jgi:hypothetical protein
MTTLLKTLHNELYPSKYAILAIFWECLYPIHWKLAYSKAFKRAFLICRKPHNHFSTMLVIVCVVYLSKLWNPWHHRWWITLWWTSSLAKVLWMNWTNWNSKICTFSRWKMVINCDQVNANSPSKYSALKCGQVKMWMHEVPFHMNSTIVTLS